MLRKSYIVNKTNTEVRSRNQKSCKLRVVGKYKIINSKIILYNI